MKKALSALTIIVLMFGCIQVWATELTVGVYPWVPRVDQFKQAIEEAWKTKHPDISLKFSKNWDGGYNDNPSQLDVFVFDAIFLSNFREEGYLAYIEDNEVDNLSDILKYAVDGSRSGDELYGIPQLGCASILFFRKGDEQLEKASSIAELVNVLGQCQYTNEKPPKNERLMVNVSGGTTAACLYVDTVEDVYGKYTINPPLPLEESQINNWAISNLRNVVAMASAKNALYDGKPYIRAKWFGEGYGRATIGYTEALSAMGNARENVDFKLMPFYSRQGGGVSLFYADIIGINSKTKNRALALELANLMASEDVIVKSIGSGSNNYPQYLMPVRHSVFNTLKKEFPLYDKMYKLVTQADPKLFRLGENARNWLTNMKSKIKDTIFASVCVDKCGSPYVKTLSYGGSGGGDFSDNLTNTVRVTQISIRHGKYVDSIQTTWLTTEGKSITGERHGGDGGSEDTFSLSEGEYITDINGRSGKLVDQLTFYSNFGKEYGPYGGSGGSPFEIKDICVGGFFGKSGKYLDAIGVFTGTNEINGVRLDL